MAKIITDYEKEKICKKYLSGCSIRNLQKQTKINPQQITKILRAANIKILSPYETLQNNGSIEIKEYFRELNSIQCYVLGVIFGDGCVQYNTVKHRYRVSITSNDLDILNSAKKLFGEQLCIKKRKTTNAYDLSIYSKHLCEELINKFKLQSPKSNKLIFPILPEENYSYFISGLLSTDGCVRIEKENFGKPCSIEFSYSSNCLEFILSLREFFNIRLNTPNTNNIKENKTRRKNINYSLRFKGANAAKILDYIYNNTDTDTICLRKYNKYLEYLNSIKNYFL